MGNYSDFETEFVQRTLALIDQNNEMIEVEGKPFREQYKGFDAQSLENSRCAKWHKLRALKRPSIFN